MDCLFVGVKIRNYTDKKSGQPGHYYFVYLGESEPDAYGWVVKEIKVFNNSPVFNAIESVFNSSQKFPSIASCSFNSNGQLVAFSVK